MQDRSHRWAFHMSRIGMPLRPNDPRRVWFFYNMDDFGVWTFLCQIRMQVEFTEIPPKCHQPLVA